MERTGSFAKLSLSEFLAYFDFSYEINANGSFSLIDLQHANLADIEEDEFEINYTGIIHCIERLDTYIYDYTLRILNESIETDFSFDDVQSALKYAEISEINMKSVAQFCDLNILNAINNPSFIQIDKINMIKIMA